MDKRGTQTNELEDKKVDDYPQGLISQRWIDSLYESREERRGFAINEDTVDASK